ncbi:Dihydrolipoyl dehydrogenase [compost metagenome]
MKLIGDKDSGLLLGAQVVGAEASNLIAEMALAIELGATVEDIALTIHAHPTLGEITMDAAEVALGHPIHVLGRK